MTAVDWDKMLDGRHRDLRLCDKGGRIVHQTRGVAWLYITRAVPVGISMKMLLYKRNTIASDGAIVYLEVDDYDV